MLQCDGRAHLELPNHFDVELTALDGDGTVAQVEAALESLGQYLVLDAQRPDNEFGTGPDVLWSAPDGPALSIEAKTDKRANSVYRKEELGQLRDHRQWVREQLGSIEVLSVFVGPIVPSSKDANPDPDMVVIELTEFQTLRNRLRAALLDVCQSALPLTAAMTVQNVFTQRGLIWPDVYERMPKHALHDIAS